MSQVVAAAQKGDVTQLHALLDKGADAAARDGRRTTALAIATQLGFADVRAALLKAGAKP